MEQMNPQIQVLIMQNFQIISIKGGGTFGDVFQARRLDTQELVVLKRIRRHAQNQVDIGFQPSTIRQISILRQLQSPYIIRIFDVINIQNQKILVLQLLKTDLRQYILSLGENFIEPAKVRKMMYALLSGIALCHKNKLMHRDLKPANILLDEQDNLKIGDFGSAKKFGTTSLTNQIYSQPIVTFHYRAPELLLGTHNYTSAIDIWSAGCIFAQLVTKKIIFFGDSDIDQKKRIFRFMGTPNQESWPGVSQLKDFINEVEFPVHLPSKLEQVLPLQMLSATGVDLLQKLLILDPKQRITARDALDHAYFKDK